MLWKERENGAEGSELMRALTQLKKAVLDTRSSSTSHPPPIPSSTGLLTSLSPFLLMNLIYPGCFNWARKENRSSAWALGTLLGTQVCWLSKHHSEDKAGHGLLSENRMPCFYFSHMRTCCDKVLDVFLTSLFWEGRLRNY